MPSCSTSLPAWRVFSGWTPQPSTTGSDTRSTRLLRCTLLDYWASQVVAGQRSGSSSCWIMKNASYSEVRMAVLCLPPCMQRRQRVCRTRPGKEAHVGSWSQTLSFARSGKHHNNIQQAVRAGTSLISRIFAVSLHPLPVQNHINLPN